MKDYSYSWRDSILTYSNWYEVMNSKPTFFSNDIKKFPTEKKVTDYIEDDLAFTDSAIEPYSFNDKTVLSNPLDMPMSIEDLKI